MGRMRFRYGWQAFGRHLREVIAVTAYGTMSVVLALLIKGGVHWLLRL